MQKIRIADITDKLSVRDVNPNGMKRIFESIKNRHYLAGRPIVVMDNGNGTYTLVDGNHRVTAAQELGEIDIPAEIKVFDNKESAYQFAFQSNEANEDYVPNTLVVYAEFVWKCVKEGYKLSDIAKMLGWTEKKTKKYSALSSVCDRAWKIIVTTFQDKADETNDEDGTSKVPIVTFSETLLREIIVLRPPQQLKLVQDLVKGPNNKGVTKGGFKALAESYRKQNEMKRYLLASLGDIGISFLKEGFCEIDKGRYDKEWIGKDRPHLGLDKLIDSIRKDWIEKCSFQLTCGDFYEEIKKIGDNSIDLILTDPPYNISRDREFSFEGRSAVPQDFGEWDRYEHDAFIDLCNIWAKEFYRILRPSGSGYIFVADRYLSHLRDALEHEGLAIKTTIVWHKTNPGTNPVQTNYRSSCEFVLFFIKPGEKPHKFRYLSENEMHNFIEAPICGGDERCKDSERKTLHPTQKPERIIRHFMEISSERGDLVFDGFMGTGTTGAVARELGRKFTGIEQDQKYFDEAKWRITGEK